MDMRRLILYVALGLISYSLWTSWQQDYVVAPDAGIKNSYANVGDNLLPKVPNQTHSSIVEHQENDRIQTTRNQPSLISVKTNVLSLLIDSKNGNVVNAKLLKYPVDAANPHDPITLLFDNPDQRYVANSNLVVSNNQTTIPIALNFHSEKQYYTLKKGEKELSVLLTAQNKDGLLVEKEFVLQPNDYKIRVNYRLTNTSTAPWIGYLNTQLTQNNPKEDSSSIFHVGSYTGASYSIPEKHRYQKLSYKQMSKNNLYEQTPGGWIAMQQHYFLSAWIPSTPGSNTLYSRMQNDTYTVGALSSAITVSSGQDQSVSADLYLGPEDTDVLKSIAPGLELTVDYGWLWFISSALFSLMKAIHNVVGNWGWSIILVTVLIKLLFYKLSATSFKSMAGMRKLQPKLQALRDRYGDDKVKISQATMELYRQEKVNPLGGCLPIIIQIPVFIALYWVLLESVELRQAPFVFWINDLAAPDPFHVLPIIMGMTMVIQQRLNPAPPDPMQAKLMMLLPVFFTVIFWSFPAGLVLYWIVNNSLSILQQWYITRKYSDKAPLKKPLAINNK